AGRQPIVGLWTGTVAVVTLFIGASGVFIELQDALNTIWRVRRNARRGWWTFVKDRLLSFGMIIGIGCRLLVSLIVSAALSAMGSYLSSPFPARETFWQVSNFTVSLAIITFLFAMIFKILPDVKIAWRDVWMGGFITAILFTAGKFL